MIKWRFAASNAALETLTGQKAGGLIKATGEPGIALFGPYLELPAGRCVARILLDGAATGQARMDIAADRGGRILSCRHVDLATSGSVLELAAELPEPLANCEVRLICEAASEVAIIGVEIDLDAARSSEPIDAARPVGFESRKTYADKLTSGFIDKYLSGPAVLELGYKGYIGGTVPIVPQAIGVDLGYPGYDGVTLPFADESFDAIYSSHCFEHISAYKEVLRDWYRLLKVGGYIIIVVPHQHLFEKKRTPPSPSNPDHKRFYTVESLTRELSDAFEENSYRIRHVAENDRGFNYADPSLTPSHGCFEIECVVEKIVKPNWNLDDGTIRTYAAREFFTDLPRPDPWNINIDSAVGVGHLFWGPYATLESAFYEADFYFDATCIDSDLSSEIELEVAQDMDAIASVTLSGAVGMAALRSGKVTVPFTNNKPGSFFEFRMRIDRAPFAGTLQFKGVNLRYAGII